MTPTTWGVPPPPMQSETTKTLSYWEKAVGLYFNPSGDPGVQKIKELYTEIIDIMDNKRHEDHEHGAEHKRLASVAITEAQTAQMRAVKALTWKD